jgi:hypothetical protein
MTNHLRNVMTSRYAIHARCVASLAAALFTQSTAAFADVTHFYYRPPVVVAPRAAYVYRPPVIVAPAPVVVVTPRPYYGPVRRAIRREIAKDILD